MEIKIGVIADDFTGAGDAASFLAMSGLQTIMFTEIPEKLERECEAVVIALKSRSVPPEDAIKMSSAALEFLQKIGCKKLYFKYCSTFDSTPKGNIGVVLDAFLEKLNLSYTLLCPSLPVNGRTVRDGILYVNGVKLEDSPLKNHPLNPMWASYLPELMKEQSKYPVYVIDRNILQTKTADEITAPYRAKNEKFYLVPDYEPDEDAKQISEKFGSLPLLSGGSGLLEFLLPKEHAAKEQVTENHKDRRAIILCASCSQASRKQIVKYREKGGICYPVDSKKLLRGELNADQIMEFVEKQNRTVLIYSEAVEGDMKLLSAQPTFAQESKKIEELMADLSERALKLGVNRIVVGGGETSGAVTLKLGFHGFYIGDNIDPGVPVLYPLHNSQISLVLKSGNFGSEEFFLKSIQY